MLTTKTPPTNIHKKFLKMAQAPENNRKSADFHPDIWIDHFLSAASDTPIMETKEQMEHQKLKEEVKRMFAVHDKLSRKLELIDAIQRLGVFYHFENEIDETLRQIHETAHDEEIKDDDLHLISLRFRLLRQQGFRTTSEVFNKFKDEQGKFKESIVNDARGMLSLYEATHLSVHGEDILEEALAFATTHLEHMAARLSPSPIASQIIHALKQTIRKGMPRLEARFYMAIYEQQESCNKVLLNFAKLDFNMLQRLHQKELSHLTSWCKDLEFGEKFPFARKRIVECFFWFVGVFIEPKYMMARRLLTKLLAILTAMDDIYDVYGTIEELELFTDSVERWDVSPNEQLPDYMKALYQAVLDLYAEIEKKLANEGKLYQLYYAKEAMKKQVRFYLIEARWFHSRYKATMEEYMPVALITSCYSLISTISFLAMEEDIITKHALEWLFSRPKILIGTETVCRLMDDIVSHKFEQKRGHVDSSVECYMRQHGATEEEAVEELRRQISDAWKDINEDCLNPVSVPMTLLTRILNLARMIDVVYKDDDGYTNAEIVLKDYVSSLFVDPVVI